MINIIIVTLAIVIAGMRVSDEILKSCYSYVKVQHLKAKTPCSYKRLLLLTLQPVWKWQSCCLKHLPHSWLRCACLDPCEVRAGAAVRSETRGSAFIAQRASHEANETLLYLDTEEQPSQLHCLLFGSLSTVVSRTHWGDETGSKIMKHTPCSKRKKEADSFPT